MPHIGVFLGSGGNKVFYVNGVLKVLKEENISINHLVGLSSSSAILFAHIFSCHDYALKIFSKRLKNNEKNFYFFKKERFPHNEIYKNSIEEMFNKYDYKFKNKLNISFLLIATQTDLKFKKLKAIFCSISIILNELKINAFNIIRKILKISKIEYDSRNLKKISRNELINFIMGSSTIYPFISLYEFKNKLILEGTIAEINPLDYLKDFDKKIIIHTEKGKTKIEKNILHLYSSKKIPGNVLDYTNDYKIKILQKNGEIDTKKNIKLIKDYLKSK